MEPFDIAVLGGGPAGLAAAIYGGRAALRVAVIEKSAAGGQILMTDGIENYPGVIDGESGWSLMQRFETSARRFGAAFFDDEIRRVDFSGEIKYLYGRRETYRARAVIVCTGARPRVLDVPGEKEYTGRGVSYCATCDGAFFRDKDVFVAGGGDAALEEAVYLTRFARKVTVIHRRDALRAARGIQQKAMENEKISILFDTVVTEVTGDQIVRGLRVKNVKTAEETTLTGGEKGDAVGLFVFIGYRPNTELFRGLLEMDEEGFLLAGEDLLAGVEGVYAAGDVRKKALRQVVTAAADGAVAAVSAGAYIREKFSG